MDNALLYAVLGLMLVAALLTVVTDRLFTAVVYAGVLSTAAAFCYLLLGAPDVALAEAVIGSTLSTAILLAALRKYRIFTIYFIAPGGGDDEADRVLDTAQRALQAVEIEPHLLHAGGEAAALLARPDCDLVIEARGGCVVLHGEEGSRPVGCIREALDAAGLADAVRFEDSLPERVAAYKEGRL